MTVSIELETTPPPSGSMAVDSTYSITDTNLALLSDSAKSTLLSVSNIGSAITSRINSTLELIQAMGSFTSYLLDETILNGLTSGSTSASLLYPNAGTSRFVRVVVVLGEVLPVSGAKVQITNGTTTYELAVSTTLSKKRLEFNDIPEEFVNSFQVKNLTGVPLASYGNSIVVIPL